MNEKNENYWLLEAPATKAIWHMALPMMLGMSVNILYNITDTFFIGQLQNTAALSAIALLLPYTTILMAIGNLFGTGGSTLFSRLIGTQDDQKAKQCAATTFWLAAGAGILAAILSLLGQNQIIAVLGGDSATFFYLKQYLVWYALGAPLIVANFTLEQLVRGNGESIHSMIGMILSVAINIVLDPILMFACHLGMQGAAIATVLGNLAAVVYYAIIMRIQAGPLTIAPGHIQFRKALLKPIFSVGVSAMMLDLLLIVSSLMFNYYALQYGDYVLAGFGISQKLVQIVDLIGMGLYLGVIPLIAVAYGANNKTRMKQILSKTTFYLGLLITILFAGLFVFRHPIVRCFTQNRDVIQIGSFILTVQLCSSFFAAGAGLLTSVFQAKGEGTPALILSISRGLILIPTIMILHSLFGLHGVIFSLLTTEVLSFFVGLALYAHDKRKETGLLG
ncbi:MATE family efflux transporter [uncultured Dubosiella sp.]|uniref:MATE family efflux transporter n=1 Tax=uncultured Dubosiella sp. TaxID=1937011 RepID=UPI0025B61DAC|nr:MATE family efflux transporter [uncultured Dubosiella sp.]